VRLDSQSSSSLHWHLYHSALVWRPDFVRPHISAWALWSELCEINALGRADAQALLPGTPLTRSVLSATPQEGWIGTLRGLTFEQRDNACFLYLANASVAFETLHLRYCPACMSSRYHCALFQHIALTRCPLHNVAIRNVCPECREEVRIGYDAARLVPFGCARCGGRLAAWKAAPFEPDHYALAVAGSLAAAMSSLGTLSRLRARTFAFRASRTAANVWWAGEDPFVSASRWRPRRAFYSPSSEPAETDRAVWHCLIDFVGWLKPSNMDLILRLADLAERRTLSVFGSIGADLQTLTLAALIARYGGRRIYEQAVRLRSAAAPASLYPPTPQRSLIVTESATANAAVFSSEAGQFCIAMAKRLMKTGLQAFVGASDIPLRVPWYARTVNRSKVELQWRALSDIRLKRVLVQGVNVKFL
jgi:hypothetical protein